MRLFEIRQGTAESKDGDVEWHMKPVYADESEERLPVNTASSLFGHSKTTHIEALSEQQAGLHSTNHTSVDHLYRPCNEATAIAQQPRSQLGYFFPAGLSRLIAQVGSISPPRFRLDARCISVSMMPLRNVSMDSYECELQ